LDQRGFFSGGPGSLQNKQGAERLDGFQILLKLLLRPSIGQTVGFRDAVTVGIAGRLFSFPNAAAVGRLAGG